MAVLPSLDKEGQAAASVCRDSSKAGKANRSAGAESATTPAGPVGPASPFSVEEGSLSSEEVAVSD